MGQNNKISDDNLFKFLRQLGVAEEDRGKGGRGSARDQQGESVPEDVKELFDGDAKKFVNDILVGRQHYLQRVRVQGPDPEVEAYEYSWGERANLEVKKSDILKKGENEQLLHQPLTSGPFCTRRESQMLHPALEI